VLPKSLQNSPKTTFAVTRRSFRAAAAPLAPPAAVLPAAAVTTPPAAAAAAPLRRHCCRFGLVDLTWVWSKVVVV